MSKGDKPLEPQRSVSFAVQVVLGLGVLALLGTFLSVRRYVSESPRFCQSCHELAPEVAVWVESEHRALRCQECHHQLARPAGRLAPPSRARRAIAVLLGPGGHAGHGGRGRLREPTARGADDALRAPRVHRDHDRRNRAPDRQSPQRHPGLRAVADAKHDRRSILVIDDQESAREILSRFLEQLGYRARVADSVAMLALFELIRKVGPADVPVLIIGESGTGKDLVARALHGQSRRAARTFLSINCAAVPESLLETELCGHERGAFSGAVRARTGYFRQADGGTLFLDEISDMSLGQQAKLLRVLESGEVMPVGSEHPEHTDVRVVAATHQDLEKLAAQGRFREDLLFRSRRCASGCRRSASGARIQPLRVRTGGVADDTYRAAREAVDRAYFSDVLARAGGSINRAAALAGIHRATLHKRLRKLQIGSYATEKKGERE